MGAPYWHLERMHEYRLYFSNSQTLFIFYKQSVVLTVVYRLYELCLMLTVYYKILQDSQYVV